MKDRKLQAILSYAKDLEEHGIVLSDFADRYREQYDLGNSIAGSGSSMEVRQHERQLQRMERDLMVPFNRIRQTLEYIEKYSEQIP